MDEGVREAQIIRDGGCRMRSKEERQDYKKFKEAVKFAMNPKNDPDERIEMLKKLIQLGIKLYEKRDEK